EAAATAKTPKVTTPRTGTANRVRRPAIRAIGPQGRRRLTSSRPRRSWWTTSRRSTRGRRPARGRAARPGW
ncbi:hypothetical protein B5180_34485, partial [Streptomyces sp. BF-3]